MRKVVPILLFAARGRWWVQPDGRVGPADDADRLGRALFDRVR
jgi:hypothetical protein